MKYGIWKASQLEAGAVNALVGSGYAPLAAMVLASRGIGDDRQARAYLDCNAPLLDPFLMTDMDKAAGRVGLAMSRGEKIAVFGDYDVDGITATCLLTDFLRRHGADVVSYIPGRLEEGYGLNPIAIHQLHAEGVKLIVTVDCGITAVSEAELCKQLGIDLVITDHHECKQTLPAAVAVVDPHRPDGGYPHKNLSGVGVAFKLASALCGSQEKVLEEYADMVCLGTVADVMPLQGENRVFVARGLESLAHTKRPGIAALMAECGCAPETVSASSIGFMLAPRINAAGRMGQIDLAVELFLTDDPDKAAEAARGLCELNRQRQAVESEIYRQAVSMLPMGKPPEAIVLADESWHQGVVGIVASRMAEEYSCPTFLICLDGDKGKASSRSYGGFNLFRSLEQLSGLLESYGGHELAAGFTIRRESIAPFREKMMALCARFRESDACSTALAIDCEIPPELLTIENIQALGDLEPCGAGCPRPILCMRGLHVTELTEVGGGKHLRLRLSKGAYTWGAIFFSTNAQRAAVAQGDVVDIAFTPQINEYRSVRSVQLNLVDIRPDKAFREAQGHDRAVYKKHLAGGELSCDEAECLLPTRQDFVAVWRYLAAFSQGGVLSEELGCLSRKISRCAKLSLSAGKTRICLDVLAEQGLLQLEQRPKSLCIRLCADGRKVDLEKSPILIHLKKQKAGT